MAFTHLSLFSLFIVACCLIIFAAPVAMAQSLGNAGTIEGSVTDQTGASIPNATVTIKNARFRLQPIGDYSERRVVPADQYSAESISSGSDRRRALPPRSRM